MKGMEQGQVDAALAEGSATSGPSESSAESAELTANPRVPGPSIAGRELALRLLPAVFLGLALLVSLSSLLVCRGPAAPESQWKELSASLRLQFQEGDLLVAAPDWLDASMRLHLGDLLSVEAAARADASGYQRIWEVSWKDAQSAATAGLASASEDSFASLRLRRYDQAPQKTLFRLSDSWRSAKVSGDVQGRPVLSLEEVGFEPHYCIKGIPRPGGAITMHFDSVEFGNTLVGYVGLADIFTRRDVREAGILRISAEGSETREINAGIDEGWKRFSMKTSPHVGTLTFELVSPSKTAKDRRICFVAETRP